MDNQATPSVLVTGARGLVGGALLRELARQGTTSGALVRGQAKSEQDFSWDAAGRSPIDARLHASPPKVVIHLAGEPIFGLWTPGKKRLIRESRIVGTENLSRDLSQLPQKPELLITASGVGAYGDRGDEVLTEESSFGSGFLADLARDWEAATQPALDAGIRVVKLRIGIVLAKNGGALAPMLPLFRAGLGGKSGSGRQWMSWITLDDLVAAILHLMRAPGVEGPVNATSPEPVSNRAFTAELAGALRRPAIFGVPAWALRMVPGGMGQEILLASQRAVPAKLLASGFEFRHSRLEDALQAMFRG